jgi:hypothetical protein
MAETTASGLKASSANKYSQRLGEAGDREIRRRRAIDDRRNDTGPQEGEGSEQTDVPFALGLPFDNLGGGGYAAEPDIVIRPILWGLGDGSEESIRLSSFIVGFAPGASMGSRRSRGGFHPPCDVRGTASRRAFPSVRRSSAERYWP